VKAAGATEVVAAPAAVPRRMGWQVSREHRAGRWASVFLAVDPALPAVMPDMLGDLGPGFRPPITAGDCP